MLTRFSRSGADSSSRCRGVALAKRCRHPVAGIPAHSALAFKRMGGFGRRPESFYLAQVLAGSDLDDGVNDGDELLAKIGEPVFHGRRPRLHGRAGDNTPCFYIF